MKQHSERVPKKNIRNFIDKPLFYYMLNTLCKCKNISEIVVDTDSEKIGKLIKTYFDKVKILYRPDELKGDMVTANALIENNLNKLKGDYFLFTHVTSPLIKPKTIDNAIDIFFKNDNDSLLGVTKHQIRLFDKDFNAINHDSSKLIRTQDLEPLYEDNSSIYVFSRDSFFKTKNRIGENPYMLEISKIESIDIDTEHDFYIAECIARNLNKNLKEI